ncbi:MAG: hypothetical protein JWN46_319 [Acidimicrobiales bacterium]|nr:hypothetical protein [Acidimicrobiales bacterium]
MSIEPPEYVAVDRRALAVLDAALTRLAAVEAAVARLEAGGTARSATSSGIPVGQPSAPDEPAGAPRRIDRRQAFGKLAGAAAAGAFAAGVVADAQPAAAANGDLIILGSVTNSASNPTGVAISGTGVAYGFGVTDNGPSSLDLKGPAILGHAQGSAFSHAGQMIATGSAVGLAAQAVDGLGAFISSVSFTALVASSQTGDAATFLSPSTNAAGVTISSGGIGMSIETIGDTQASLQTSLGTTAPPPPATSQTHLAGDLQVDTDGSVSALQRSPRSNLWFCVGDGTPGTWRKLAGPATAGAFHVLHAPVRVYDSRPGTSPSTPPKTRLVAGTARTLDVTGNSSGVPKGATAVMCNLLVVNAASGNGNFTIWANGVARPAANNMVWGGSTGRFSSLAVTALDANAKCQVVSNVGTDFVLDIVGYYR